MKLKKDKELLVLGWIILLVFGASSVKADEIKHQFKNPSFSGIGTGAHYLTIENQEFSRKKAIEDALEAARKALQKEKQIIQLLQNLLEI